VEQGREQHLQLQAREGRTEAEPGAEPKAQVRVGRAGDVEPCRVGEVDGVLIGRAQTQQHQLARRDLDPVELDVLPRVAHQPGALLVVVAGWG
jgi:hypothetical protein